MAKKKIAIFFGGSSEEHDVSIMSAKSILTHIDRNLFEVVMIGFNRSNVPYHVEDLASTESAVVFEKANKMSTSSLVEKLQSEVDVVFPIIHGPGGEDGQLQGFLKVVGVPFVGADVTASGICMDKRLAKEILRMNGFKQAPYVSVLGHLFRENPQKIVDETIRTLKYPVFVKPSNLGSSIGITKVGDPSQLEAAINTALAYDRSVVIEEGINARELECGVLGNEHPVAMSVGEIVSSHDFYDYEAKYSDNCPSELMVPAVADAAVIETIRTEAVRAYQLLGVEGMARVDFFVDKLTDEVYINELNTLPGFTKFSMYPLLCAASGLGYSDLITELITLALRRNS
ncbi:MULTISPECIES: D-alanine--D-alanine ligase family protein [unclassified Fusibacter]|uniref:D-alanine--D-alanine ligase family protein n=1 Tax=unclassified Fusibacter TaxID=2624464 RepID=UPI00101397FE|nr:MULTISPECIES: D-alanine--D-alanine ligase family protein [unclassified Fusibacter]MCK8059300.1 D-alanine--D-alanine ligase [Fusibacter sp. A2]NPE21236.1 D-alanine--D-alanine ligase [Fusibacter sp. A1]RXV62503.1 D-alanine--D-alanine ligase [Fusibacter sp. A1]